MDGDAVTRKGKFKPAQKVVLHSAVKENKLSFIKLLHKNGTKLDTPDSAGKTALMWASRFGHEEIIAFLLEAGADHNATDNAGKTAVHEAAMYGQLGALRILAEAGADLDKVTKSGQTPLHFAANKTGITKFLLDKGVNVFKRDNQGYTAVHWAVSKSQNNKKTLKMLIAKGGELLLDAEIVSLMILAARAGNLGHVKFIEKRASDMKRTSISKTILHEAATYDRVEIVGYYIGQRLYETDIRDKDGWTCLHIAATLGYLDLALLLISLGAKVDARTFKGSTPLKLAVINSREPLVKILIDNGADINAKDNDDVSILDLAERQSNMRLVVYLVKRGAITHHHIKTQV